MTNKAIRAANNLAAISLLKSEGKLDKAILSKYSGWGGLSEVFFLDFNSPEWAIASQEELKELVSESEYQILMDSSSTAFYTPLAVCETIWETLVKFGFKSGLVLEPAIGGGAFYESCPIKAQWIGVELDPIAAQITAAKTGIPVYPLPFQEAPLPKGIFDLVISNVPFGEEQIFYPERNAKFSIHNYFILKALELTRPGGLIALITSTYTLDAKGTEVREYIAEQAELLSAVRLPEGAFSETNTSVTTDILFLRKRLEPKSFKKEEIPSWVIAQTANNFRPEAIPAIANIGYSLINEWYWENPEKILGIAESSAQFGPDGRIVVKESGPWIGTIAEKLLPGGAVGKHDAKVSVAPPLLPVEHCRLSPYDTFKQNGLTFMRTAENTVIEIKGGIEVALIEMYSTFSRVCRSQSEGDKALEAVQSALKEQYQAFLGSYGYIHDADPGILKHDPRYQALCSMEIEVEDCPYRKPPKAIAKSKLHYRLADICTKRVCTIYSPPERVDTLDEAIIHSLTQEGIIELELICRLLGKEVADFLAEMDALGADAPIFFDPGKNQFVTASEYLSGDVVSKLEIARSRQLIHNITALGGVQPLLLLPRKDQNTPSEVRDYLVKTLGEDTVNGSFSHYIDIALSNSWIPEKVIEDYLLYLFGLERRCIRATIRESYLVKLSDTWMSYAAGSSSGELNVQDCNLVRDEKIKRNVLQLFEDALRGESPRIYDEFEVDGKVVKRLNVDDTTFCRVQVEKITDNFLSWVWTDAERALELVQIFNSRFNRVVEEKIDGSGLIFPGKNPDIKFDDYQLNAIYRGLHVKENFGFGLFHATGAGKTYVLTAIAMRLIQLKKVSRVLMVVLNSTLKSFEKEVRLLYPTANVLVGGEKVTKEERTRFMWNLLHADYEIAIVPQSFWSGFITLSPGIIDELAVQEEMAISAFLREQGSDLDGREKRRLEAQRKRLLDYHKTATDRAKKEDGNIFFLDLLRGFAIVIDEAHNYKNLPIISNLSVPGIPTSFSNRAVDNMYKVLYTIGQGCPVFGATATPIANSVVETWVWMSLFARKTLEELGVLAFDAFRVTFLEVAEGIEFNHTGKLVSKTRLQGIVNQRLWMQLLRQNADVLVQEDLSAKLAAAGKPLPDIKVIKHKCAITSDQQALMRSIVERAKKLDSGQVDPKDDNHLVLTHDARCTTTDPRLIREHTSPDINSKLYQTLILLMQIREATNPYKGVTAVFCDMSALKQRASKGVNIQLGEESHPFLLTATWNFSLEKIEYSLRKRQATPKLKSLDPDLWSRAKRVTAAHLKEAEKILAGMSRREIESTFGAISIPWNVPLALKAGWIKMGLPEEEFVIIDKSVTASKMTKILDDLNAGKIRVVMGSTPRLGTGLCFDRLLAAIIGLDVGYRVVEFLQRLGRILRRRNLWSRPLAIYLLTEGIPSEGIASADAYMMGMLERKSKGVTQALRGDLDGNQIEEIDRTTLTFASLCATASGDDRFKRSVELRGVVHELQALLSGHEAQLRGRRSAVSRSRSILPTLRAALERCNAILTLLLKYEKENPAEDYLPIINGEVCDSPAKFKKAIKEAIALYETRNLTSRCRFGSIGPFEMVLLTERKSIVPYVSLNEHGDIPFFVEDTDKSSSQRLAIKGYLAPSLERVLSNSSLSQKKADLLANQIAGHEAAIAESDRLGFPPFPQEEELIVAIQQLEAIEAELGREAQQLAEDDDSSAKQSNSDDEEEKEMYFGERQCASFEGFEDYLVPAIAEAAKNWPDWIKNLTDHPPAIDIGAEEVRPDLEELEQEVQALEHEEGSFDFSSFLNQSQEDEEEEEFPSEETQLELFDFLSFLNESSEEE